MEAEQQKELTPAVAVPQDVTTLTILHLGDVFLDGPVERLRRDTKEHRREELRESFASFMEQVEKEGADAVVFSGNLLDGSYVGEDTLRFLVNSFQKHPHCHFVIAPGPEDPYHQNSIYRSKRFPRNVHVFVEETLGVYNFPDLPLTVYGWGYRARRAAHAPLSGAVRQKNDRFTLLCGYTRLDEASEQASVSAEALVSFGAHYTALSGQVHDGFHRAGRGVYAYSGSFEGREGVLATEQCGGYVRIRATKREDGWEVDAKRMALDTYSYATETIDVSHMRDAATVRELLLARIRERGYGAKTVLRVRLCGSVPLEADFAGVDNVDVPLYSLWVEDCTLPTDTDGRLLQEMTARGELYRYFYPQMQEGTEEERVGAARAFRIAYAALLGQDFAKY